MSDEDLIDAAFRAANTPEAQCHRRPMTAGAVAICRIVIADHEAKKAEAAPLSYAAMKRAVEALDALPPDVLGSPIGTANYETIVMTVLEAVRKSP